jgi:hypothetical protein
MQESSAADQRKDCVVIGFVTGHLNKTLHCTVLLPSSATGVPHTTKPCTATNKTKPFTAQNKTLHCTKPFTAQNPSLQEGE